MTYEINAERWVSPNHSERTKPIKMLVIHATASDTLESAANWLCLKSSEVSTHYIIDELGNIFQLVDDRDVAWHVGRAKWDDITDVNGVSIGIELVNTNSGKDPYEAAQVAALTWLVEFKAHQHGVSLDNIVRHLDVAVPSGRKTDPRDAVGFHWLTWKKQLTVGSDETIWNLWGSVIPLYPDTRHFGIPQAWFKVAAKLGEARSHPIYSDDVVIQVFQRGVILYRAGKSRIVFDTEIGT
jgi:N-acetyl-anhydromuramyl-L-alanine amidase AmpD